MTVAAILSEKGRKVVTVDGEMPISRICATLAENRIGAAVIVDGNQNVQGIISERDIVKIVASTGGAALNQPASSVMTREVITCSEEETIGTLMEKMTEGKFRHVPVLDGGKLTGIISIGDVVKRRIADIETEWRAMQDYIAAG